ncbi:DUF421 domain-containing protein [Pontibacillus sp. ALD_SL1]|uniref:DUF421 domain-containing protein n=1 Tax=Pontibacillus sp. ALD_SL1 TaxID=2777185 RepID=UPI001A964911|nr:DUF421 domain-containing protein [Pontibacillus sp. ALD_SL1]QST00630.1 DUF421 domain-containing protein [Pontibacillus sp. ALD_SL1]
MFNFLPPLLLIFVLYILVVRLLGKSALAQLTPHDFAALFFLAYVAFQPIQIDTYFQSLIGIIGIGLTHYALSRMSLMDGIKHFIIGQPTVLIRHGVILPENLKKSRFSLVELLSVLRTSGHPRVKEIEYAFLEPNGDISVIPKRESAPLTPADMGMELPYQGIPLSVIVEGKVQHRNLSLIEKDETWLLEQLNKQNYTSTLPIFFAYVLDGDTSIHISEYPPPN